MKSITIHKLDDELEKVIVAKARERGVSQNQLIKELLRNALGLEDIKRDHRADFEEFLGIWTDEDVAAFEERTASFREVDEAEWQ